MLKKVSIKKLVNILIIFFFLTNNLNAKSYSSFIENITTRASTILIKDLNKDEKIAELRILAEESVDIRGIGLYSLGKHRKTISKQQLKEYEFLFREYFLKSFSSRLSQYSDPRIIVLSEEILNKNYTMVSSVLVASEKRPEVKIDWRVYTKNPNEPLIRDLIIEGLSLARTQKEEFNSVIKSNDGNINILFNNLREFIK
tara:strand:- start:49 stop:648 length:600 start_codon:yes stop_codon:yes gene_type:complete